MNRKVFSALFLLPILFLSVSGCGDDSPSGTGSGSSFFRPVVVMETSLGELVIELYRDRSPMTVMNSLQYIHDGFYDGLILHRVIPGFLIQGGGYDENLELREPGKAILNEADNGLSNLRGTISMARTQVIDSARSQFFINVVDNTGLDHRDDTDMGFGYCVFGRVIEGMDVLDAITEVETGTSGNFQYVPVEPVFIVRAYRKR